MKINHALLTEKNDSFVELQQQENAMIESVFILNEGNLCKNNENSTKYLG